MRDADPRRAPSARGAGGVPARLRGARARRRPMVALCDRIGAEYVAVADGDDACGGYPLLAAGQLDAFRLHAERWRASSPATRAWWCTAPRAPGRCARSTARSACRSLPPSSTPSSSCEGFAERLPMQDARQSAFYHDPCYLGRHLGLYDPPRRLAGKAVEDLREFSRSRNESECSGGGGLLPVTMPDTADAIADHRLEEVHEAGVARGRHRLRDLQAPSLSRRRQGRRRDRAFGIDDSLDFRFSTEKSKRQDRQRRQSDDAGNSDGLSGGHGVLRFDGRR